MTNEPTVLVCGGRDFTRYSFLASTLHDLFWEREWYISDGLYGAEGNWLPNVRIIAGGAKGADTLAIDYAVTNFCPFKEFPADWDKHGRAAGPIRNQQMLDEGKPCLVVAFPTEKSRGTWDMIRRAKKAGVETLVFR